MEDNSPMKNHRRIDKKGRLYVVGLMFILVAIVLMVVFFLNGETWVNGSWEGIKVTETVTCESDAVAYPIFSYNNADGRLLRIVATFTNKTLDNISLMYQLKYSNTTLAEKSDAENQAAMNISFGNNGFHAYAFNTKFSNINGVFQMTLYAKSEELNDNALKYFLLDDLQDAGRITQDSVMEVHAGNGFNCVYKN